MAATTSDRSWQTVLRERGYRLTPQRELVLDAVERLGHATPEEIHEEVSRLSTAVNLSTVYRTLSLLDQLDLVRQVYLTDRTPVYHSKTMPAHVHLTCSTCGAVIDADPADFVALAVLIADKHGFDIKLDRLTLSGLCTACRS